MPIDSFTIKASLTGATTLADLIVVGFTISETLSQPYRAVIDLVTPGVADPGDIDLDQVLTQEYALLTNRGDDEWPLHGVVVAAEHLGGTPDHRQRYRIELAPQLWLCSLTRRTRAWANTTVPDAIKSVLRAAKMDLEVKLSGSYPTLDHVTQFEETDFDFVSRLMEHEGICYWFKHTKDAHCLVLGDSANAHPPASQGIPVQYEMGEGGQDGKEAGGVTTFTRRHQVVIKEVVVRDYDPQHPTTPLLGRKTVKTPRATSVDGIAEEADHHILGEAGEANRYAGLRSEEQASQRELHHGQGSVPALRAGSPFNLKGSEASEGDYLVVSVQHRWSDSTGGQGSGYRSQFTAIRRALLPWRPARKTAIPRIPGLVTGKILATAGHQTDKHLDGAYRVAVLCEGETTERVVRMAQPYAGPAQGFHFPLPIDTEVVLGHLHGHPDRPIIAGALPNVENPSPVVEENKTQCVVRSAAGAALVIEDKKDEEKVDLTSAKGHRFVLDDTKGEEKAELTTKAGHKLLFNDKAGEEKTELTTFSKHTMLFNDKSGAEMIDLTSSKGHKLTIDDTKKSMVLLSANGNKFALDDEKKLVEMVAVDDFSLDAGKTGKASFGDNLDVTSDGEVTFESLKKLTLKVGSASITLEASGKITIAGSNIEVSAQAQAKISGSAMVEVSGGMIKLN